MQISDTFIIVKKQAKALQIEKIEMGRNGVYAIKFKNSPTMFHYRFSDVIWLKESVWHDYQNCKVFIGGNEQSNVTEIRSFQEGERCHWRITFSGGYVQDYLDGTIRVIESCLSDDIARNSFEFLKRISQTNELGKDEEHGGILPSLYEKIDFIDKNLVASPYLAPLKYKVRKYNSPQLIFPFGCNASQKEAVTVAFENQVSVIQGPPGTGKTQTILNIIANIIMQGKTVMVVSNNNSATENVLEKLQKYGFGFLVAPLGKRDNKEEFVKNQPVIPEELLMWQCPMVDSMEKRHQIVTILSKLHQVFALQEELSSSIQEIKAVELEWEHFKSDNKIEDGSYLTKKGVKAKRYMNLWLRYQAYAEGDVISAQGFFGRLRERIMWMWMNISRKYLLGINSPFNPNDLQPTLLELQGLYYLARLDELHRRVEEAKSELALSDAKTLTSSLTSLSMTLLKEALFDKYHNAQRRVYQDVKELRTFSDEFCKQYPVVLSTTFSARTSLPDVVFDYIIMDEASQVSIETGALALTCAKNAVIVGDTLQLPNVVTDEDRQKMNAIFDEYKVHQGYNCAEYSFLQSVCVVLPQVKQTLLREHYRCHPKIINFCNQRFYGGNLLIMTEDHEEKDVIMVVKTKPGHHSRQCILPNKKTSKFNEREIDVIKQEVLPLLKDQQDIGIVSPYNGQVNKLHEELADVESATIHKFQGREKDTIIMSVVDDQISEFANDANLLNVAISRAKNHFCLVVTGNSQEQKGNITEFVDYINYHNFTVIESKVSSIFDYLYSHYSEERIAFLKGHKRISEYDSENLTYSLIESIIKENPNFSHLGVLCHTPLRIVIKDWMLMNADERQYVSNYSTHIDFLVINHVTRKPVLAIETDGYNFHHHETEQYKRDQMKNHILDAYGLPLLRLSTTGSSEKEKIAAMLSELVN